MARRSNLDVAIVGAGPYGLSVAAHLSARKVRFQLFGKAMTTWRRCMPKDMLLKSEGFASSISSPNRQRTLEAYCSYAGLPYRDIGLPVPLDVFIDYANWFRERCVPNDDQVDVTIIEQTKDGFSITLEDGSIVEAANVVMATGITWQKRVPESLAELPLELASHSADHRDACKYAGKSVVVIGSGASAIDTAALFHADGADVRILARQQKIHFHNAPGPRSLLTRIRNPQSGIGPGLRSKFYCTMPLAFRQLPASLRSTIVQTEPKIAPGWFMRERIEGRIPALLGHHIKRANPTGNGVDLIVSNDAERETILCANHIVAATGYDADIRRVPILAQTLRDKVAHWQFRPILTRNFESSVSGLHFVGPISSHNFGPLMRFVVGTDWVAPRLAYHLQRRIP